MSVDEDGVHASLGRAHDVVFDAVADVEGI
jgi:hypothetical protein